MIYPELEEKMHSTRQALDGATIENIIERCKRHLELLAEYRSELYKLTDTPGINLRFGSSSKEEVESTRKAVRVAIEDLTQEHNRTAALLLSFTAVSGYEAVETLNSQKYKGYDNWELRAGGVRPVDSTVAERMTIQEAVDTTSLLRREAYIVRNAATEGQK
jgi:hypothetical protein